MPGHWRLPRCLPRLTFGGPCPGAHLHPGLRAPDVSFGQPCQPPASACKSIKSDATVERRDTPPPSSPGNGDTAMTCPVSRETPQRGGPPAADDDDDDGDHEPAAVAAAALLRWRRWGLSGCRSSLSLGLFVRPQHCATRWVGVLLSWGEDCCAARRWLRQQGVIVCGWKRERRAASASPDHMPAR